MGAGRTFAGRSTAAAVPARCLKRIIPEPTRRVGETPYKEKPTLVLLQDVTLQQVVGLTHRLIGGPAGLRARSLRLTAPRADDPGDRRNAELTLSYLIYEPAGQETEGASP